MITLFYLMLKLTFLILTLWIIYDKKTTELSTDNRIHDGKKREDEATRKYWQQSRLL